MQFFILVLFLEIFNVCITVNLKSKLKSKNKQIPISFYDDNRKNQISFTSIPSSNSHGASLLKNIGYSHQFNVKPMELSGKVIAERIHTSPKFQIHQEIQEMPSMNSKIQVPNQFSRHEDLMTNPPDLKGIFPRHDSIPTKSGELNRISMGHEALPKISAELKEHLAKNTSPFLMAKNSILPIKPCVNCNANPVEKVYNPVPVMTHYNMAVYHHIPINEVVKRYIPVYYPIPIEHKINVPVKIPIKIPQRVLIPQAVPYGVKVPVPIPYKVEIPHYKEIEVKKPLYIKIPVYEHIPIYHHFLVKDKKHKNLRYNPELNVQAKNFINNKSRKEEENQEVSDEE